MKLDVVEYAISELELDGSDVEIDIEYETLEDECGHSWQTGEDSFTICLAKDMSFVETIKTLFHEMAHVKQQYDGRYVVEEGVEGRRIWCGEEVDLPYSQTPWEIDAVNTENYLYAKWTSYYKMEIDKWKKTKTNNLKVKTLS